MILRTKGNTYCGKRCSACSWCQAGRPAPCGSPPQSRLLQTSDVTVQNYYWPLDACAPCRSPLSPQQSKSSVRHSDYRLVTSSCQGRPMGTARPWSSAHGDTCFSIRGLRTSRSHPYRSPPGRQKTAVRWQVLAPGLSLEVPCAEYVRRDERGRLENILCYSKILWSPSGGMPPIMLYADLCAPRAAVRRPAAALRLDLAFRWCLQARAPWRLP